MDKLKAILTLIAVILGALGLLAAIGLVYSLLNYLLVFAVICLGGYIAVKLLVKPERRELKTPGPQKKLKNIRHILDQYKEDQ